MLPFFFFFFLLPFLELKTAKTEGSEKKSGDFSFAGNLETLSS